MTTPSTSSSGFDVVLGNPPWERVKLQEQEFFSSRDPEIAGAPNAAARKRAITALKDTNPALLHEFREASRRAEGESHLLRSAGRYPLCGRGDINTYAVFAETARDTIAPTGRLGVIVPTGIATDDTTKFFFGDLIATHTLVQLLSFENEGLIFPSVHHFTKFCLLTVVGASQAEGTPIDFVFYARTLEHANHPDRRFTLTPPDLLALNPNTRTCSIFRSSRDAEITKGIYRRVPVLIREARDGQPESNPWGITFMAMFHMANNSDLFVEPEIACPAVSKSLAADRDATPPYLPLYEAKMLHQFDHRWATYAPLGMGWLDGILNTRIDPRGDVVPDARDMTREEHGDPDMLFAPRYWVAAFSVEDRLVKYERDPETGEQIEVWRWHQDWLVGWRDIANAVNERTLIAAVVPRVSVGHTVPLMLPDQHSAAWITCLVGSANSLVVDYAARQKVGGTHLTHGFLKQFPVLPPQRFEQMTPWDGAVSLANWITPRVLELVYTAHDLAGFAEDLWYDGPPFRWDESRRDRIRAELDAAFFHLYGVSRDDVDYIMDTFTVFKSREEQRNGGVFRTKEKILATYDEMAEAIASDGARTYQTALEPPPGPPIDGAGDFLPMAQWDALIWQRYQGVIHAPREEFRPAAAAAIVGRRAPVGVGGFPDNERDRLLVAAALALIDPEGIDEETHLDAMILMAAPQRCRTLCANVSEVDAAFAAAPVGLVGDGVRWGKVLSYLEVVGIRAIRRDVHSGHITRGENYADVVAHYPSGLTAVAKVAIEAANALQRASDAMKHEQEQRRQAERNAAA